MLMNSVAAVSAECLSLLLLNDFLLWLRLWTPAWAVGKVQGCCQLINSASPVSAFRGLWSCKVLMKRLMTNLICTSCLFATRITCMRGGFLEENSNWSAWNGQCSIFWRSWSGVAWLIVKLDIVDGTVNVQLHRYTADVRGAISIALFQ